MAPGDRLERVPLVGAVESGDASRLRRPRTAAGYAAGVVALVAVLALAFTFARAAAAVAAAIAPRS